MVLLFEIAHLCFSEAVELAYSCYLNKIGLSCNNEKQNVVTVNILITIFVSSLQ